MNLAVAPAPRAVRADGVWVETATGRRMMDLTSGMATVNLGHNPPRVLAAARAQLDRLLHTGGVFGTDATDELAERLAGALPGGISAFGFATSGSEAVEGALRLAARATGRRAVVAFRGGFHGRSLGALACSSARADARAGWAALGANVHVSPFPDDESPEAAGRALERLDDLHRHELPPGDTACYLVEPVQGAGGCRPAGRDFLAGLRARADRHGALLVLDEVQTGFGRAGAPFGADLYGVRPDVVCLAKAIANGFPLSAVGGSHDLVMSASSALRGPTFGGNPMSCAAACAVIETIHEERLAQRARDAGAAVRARLREIAAAAPFELEVRGEGLLIGLAAAPGWAAALRAAIFAEGVVVTLCGPDSEVVRLLPPLVISDWELEMALVALERAVARVGSGSRYPRGGKMRWGARSPDPPSGQSAQGACGPAKRARSADPGDPTYST